MRSRHASEAAAVVFFAFMSFGSVVVGQEQAPPFPSPVPETGPAQAPSGQAPPGTGAPHQGRGGWGRRGGVFHTTPRTPTGPTVKLPAPKTKSDTSLEQALWNRRSLRSAMAGQITLEDAGQLLWAAQGITGEWGRRAAPSAGAAYPLEVLLVAVDVAGLPAGIYRYYAASSELERIFQGDPRPEVAPACRLNGVEKAPAIVVITAVESRASGAVPSEGMTHQNVAIEAGAASQNLLLEAVALGLGTAVVPDSDPPKLIRALQLPRGEMPLVIVVVSRQ